MAELCRLINGGAEFNLDGIDVKPVLFHGAKNNLPLVVKRLSDAGLDLNITDDEGKTALIYAIGNHSMDALCKLIECDAEFKLDEIDAKAVLFHAAEYDYSGTIDKLHNKGFDLNTADDEGKTAVFYSQRNHSMDALCKLIGCGAEFKLHEIDDAKGLLFYAAKNEHKDVVKPLYNAGLDLEITDEQGKTVVFYGDDNFLDTLMEVVEVVIDARDHYGRTPLFYALEDDDTTKARYLIEKGANLKLKDNCNTSIFTFFAEKFISRNVAEKELFTSHLKEEQPQAVTHAVFNILYCQAPLLSVRIFPHLIKPYAIFNKTNVLEALAFARQQYVIQKSHNVGDIDEVVLVIRGKNVMDVPRILSLLINLGADPQTTDSDGNTAFHYATLLPLYDVAQDDVMDICKKLKKFGTMFHTKNHQDQSPLLFSLSSNTWKVATENNSWQSSIRGLFEVCRFLLSSKNVILNSEFIFYRIISRIQEGLELSEEAQRKAVVQALVNVLELLRPHEKAVRNAVNYTNTLLNSPLHLWASIALKTPQDYTAFGTEDFTFESIMERILDHLLKCGVHVNARNVNDETPLHECRTWTAVKLLLDAGANPSDQNSFGHSPLLAAAKKKYASKKAGRLYPDVTEEPESFWKCAIQKKLDPWVADKQEETILSVLIKSEDFPLSRALVEVACNEESIGEDVKLSTLRSICKDKLKHTHWKTILVDLILMSAGTRHLALESPLRLCCQNIVKFGMFDDQQPVPFQATNDKRGEDDGQPLTKKARKDESTNEQKSNEIQITYDSVYCKIAKQLLLHGVDIYSPDQSGICCLDVANDCPSLRDLLTKPIEIDTIPIVIPWASVSDRCKGLLAKVARRQECKVVNQVWYHREHIGSDSFWRVFAGIDKEDGREVAVRRAKKLRLKNSEDKREVENLVALADSEHVVRYISFFEDEDFSYLCLELMEGSLEQFLDGSTIDTAEATRLCKDIVMGLQFLHKQQILGVVITPLHILYKVHPKLCLKFADLGVSRAMYSECTTRCGAMADTRCWIAPEVLKSKKYGVDPTSFGQAADMFSCGLLLHYILSGQKHPFHPNNCANKTELQVSHETEANITNGKMEGWDDSLFPEATHLVKELLKSNENDRPSAAKALEHPLFWSNKEKIDFLEVVGNQKEFECPRSKRHPSSSTQVEQDLEKRFSIVVKHKDWNRSTDMNKIYHEMKRRRKYKTSSAVELVRFIRNTYVHYRDNTFGTPTPIEQMLFNDFVFLKCFPDLVIEVYKPVTTYGWDKTRDDIKCFLNNIRIR